MGKKREFDIRFHHADGSRAGSMVCATCNQDIDSDTDDWMESKKTIDKWGDWGYVSRHRACVKNQRGWRKIEKEAIEYEREVSELAEYMSKYKDSDGNFNSVFYGALEVIGITT